MISAPSALSSPEESISQSARRVLEKHCVSCHGTTLMSGLDLRQKEAMLRGGARGAAITPGNAEESLLFLAVSHHESVDVRMPLGGQRLTDQELEVLRRWIDLGAPWEAGAPKTVSEPSWWSFKKLRHPTVPQLERADQPLNPIDAFLLARLQEKDLEPAPRCDRITPASKGLL